jgi:hypothetical protein
MWPYSSPFFPGVQFVELRNDSPTTVITGTGSGIHGFALTPAVTLYPGAPPPETSNAHQIKLRADDDEWVGLDDGGRDEESSNEHGWPDDERRSDDEGDSALTTSMGRVPQRQRDTRQGDPLRQRQRWGVHRR